MTWTHHCCSVTTFLLAVYQWLTCAAAVIRVILCEQLDGSRGSSSQHMWAHYVHSCAQLSHYHLQKHQYVSVISSPF